MDILHFVHTIPHFIYKKSRFYEATVLKNVKKKKDHDCEKQQLEQERAVIKKLSTSYSHLALRL